MTEKKIGYVELQWECPNCGTINPGQIKVCQGCGAPQPEDVEFTQASRQELIKDEEKLKKAKAGADIHCAYCGTRNPAGAERCSQCKADLSEGHQRKAGRVVGAYRGGLAQKIQCPHCGTENLETANRCSQCGGSLAEHPALSSTAPQSAAKTSTKRGRSVLGILGLILLIGCFGIYFIFLRTNTTTGTVTDASWERMVVLEQLVPVKYQDWYDQIPQGAQIQSCTSEERDQVETPVEGSQEICGTPYNRDTGSGFAEVVQDCVYIVYDDYCTYSVLEWDEVDVITLSGDGFSPQWPNPNLPNDQRLGEGEETYQIFFSAGSEDYVFTTSNYDLFLKAQPGTEWQLEINSIGGVQSINP
ncbi:MAG: hypothetical protein GWN14_19120 [candidate division Zixibacteria bacterium]|nr:hypothetical protein [Gammaproteobacteria bacterium]NIX57970.1 hypothetical protein [candidate division Zixibacteria bacterium]